MSEEKNTEAEIRDQEAQKEKDAPVKEEQSASGGQAPVGDEDKAKEKEEKKEPDGAEVCGDEKEASSAEEKSGDGSGDNGAEEKKEAPKTADEQKKEDDEKYMRLMAEFQNYKKRVAKEKQDIQTFANEKIVKELLEVLDNFERSLQHSDDIDENYVKGMEMIFQQLRKALEDAGLSEIDALGTDFDPTLHNAVMQEDSEEYESGKVSKVLQKGYKLNDKVIRAAMVAVVK